MLWPFVLWRRSRRENSSAKLVDHDRRRLVITRAFTDALRRGGRRNPSSPTLPPRRRPHPRPCRSASRVTVASPRAQTASRRRPSSSHVARRAAEVRRRGVGASAILRVDLLLPSSGSPGALSRSRSPRTGADTSRPCAGERNSAALHQRGESSGDPTPHLHGDVVLPPLGGADGHRRVGLLAETGRSSPSSASTGCMISSAKIWGSSNGTFP